MEPIAWKQPKTAYRAKQKLLSNELETAAATAAVDAAVTISTTVKLRQTCHHSTLILSPAPIDPSQWP